jgi:penicillin-binding protein 2
MFKSRWLKNIEDIEPHEVLLDSLAKRREEEGGVSEKKIEVPLLRRILQGFFIFCFLIISGLFIKTFQFQVIRGQEFLDQAEQNRFIFYKTQAGRGVIYDKNMNQLVSNEISFDLIFQKNYFPEEENEKERVLKEISEAIKISEDELKSKIEAGEEMIVENLDHETLVILETKIENLPGFEIKQSFVRNYADGADFSHIIGYTSKIKQEEIRANPDIYSITDYVGRDGIENYYEDVLRRDPGQLRIERNAQGDILSKEVVKFPESGKSLVLWLDSDLQKTLKSALEKTLQSIGGKKGTAIALDPKTGGVLALVSLPGFDNNLFQKGADSEALQDLLDDSQKLKPIFNRAISGRYLVGSTIKPLIVSAALEEEIISPNKDINCQGSITIPNQYNPDLNYTKRDWTVHGLTDMRKAIAESCDVYFYTIGGGFGDQEGLGPSKIKEYLELFGWNSKTGIDLPGETTGFIPDKDWKKETLKENWWDGDTYNLSIGQGFLQISPLEVAASFVAIANGGTLYQPQVVQKIVDSSDSSKIIEEFESKIVRNNFINPDYLQVAREGMRQAVTGIGAPQASSIVLNSLPVAVAAKTGTAELGNDRYNNWVTVFAPYDDPQIVLTIVVEDIKGAQVAALPIAKETLEWYFGAK